MVSQILVIAVQLYIGTASLHLYMNVEFSHWQLETRTA